MSTYNRQHAYIQQTQVNRQQETEILNTPQVVTRSGGKGWDRYRDRSGHDWLPDNRDGCGDGSLVHLELLQLDASHDASIRELNVIHLRTDGVRLRDVSIDDLAKDDDPTVRQEREGDDPDERQRDDHDDPLRCGRMLLGRGRRGRRRRGSEHIREADRPAGSIDQCRDQGLVRVRQDGRLPLGPKVPSGDGGAELPGGAVVGQGGRDVPHG